MQTKQARSNFLHHLTSFLAMNPSPYFLEKEISTYAIEEKQIACDYILANEDVFKDLNLDAPGVMKDFYKKLFSFAQEQIFETIVENPNLFSAMFTNVFFLEEYIKLFFKSGEDSSRVDRILQKNAEYQTNAFRQIQTGTPAFHLSSMITKLPKCEKNILAWGRETNLIKNKEEEVAMLLRVNEDRFTAKQRNPSPVFFKKPFRGSALHLYAACTVATNAVESTAKFLRDDHPDLEARDENDNTPLLISTLRGNPNMTLLFLSFGAKVNVTNEQGFEPCFYASTVPYVSGAEAFSMRDFLSKIAILEIIKMNPDTMFFDLNDIKTQTQAVINTVNSDRLLRAFRKREYIQAFCGYIIANVPDEQRFAALQFFKTNCPNVSFDLAGSELLLTSAEQIFKTPRMSN